VPEHDQRNREVMLAEYSALRNEILQRMGFQWSIFALQLTAAGVIFSFSLSSSSHTGFLLIIPIATYVLSGRYLAVYLGIRNISAYIREVLEPKANGQLNWEGWCAMQQPRARPLTLLNPLFLAFPGIAVAALVWVAPYVWGHPLSAGTRILIASTWFIGIAVTGLSFHLIGRIATYYWRRTPV